jgi:non-reducing end alpha-L-arabinofuranosidase
MISRVSRGRLRRMLLLIAVLAVALAVPVLGTAARSQAAAQGPCDIYAAGGTPCVAAHSTVRALYAAYDGPLYQVRRASDATTANIGVLSAGGVADAAAQDAFCAGTTCTIARIYDQSGHGTDLLFQGPGGAGGDDTAANAASLPVTVDGQKAYALYITPGTSYWANGSSSGMPTGSEPEGEYMIASGTHVNSGCCFDYGNSETGRTDDGDGSMDAINFGTSCWFGGCTGSGPWVQADLENGLFSGGSQTWNSGQVAFTSPFVTAMLKNNGTTQFALKGANAQSGGLTTLWNGALPSGYSPMKKEGALVLGSGGDCCATKTNLDQGTFYEGAIVAGYPSDATDNAVQANVVAAGYSAAATPLVPGARVSIRATTAPCCTGDYIQHDASDDKVVIAPVTSASSATAKADATWLVEPGLANSACISFQSANVPGDYLRHADFELYLEPNDGSHQFALDATFCVEPANNGNSSDYSFQSVDYPSDFIRHYDYVVYLASDDGSYAWDTTRLWTQDTSFLAATPWS